MFQRRTLLKTAALSALPLANAWSQAAFPSKPLKIVVPFGAGGVADLTARAVAQKLSENLGQPVVIDNRPSAGGIVAGEIVARAEPDGHTLLLMSNGTAVSAGLFKSLPFNPRTDFAPVSLLGLFDMAVVVPENSPFKTLAELIAYGRANPGKLNMGTINIGIAHLLGHVGGEDRDLRVLAFGEVGTIRGGVGVDRFLARLHRFHDDAEHLVVGGVALQVLLNKGERGEGHAEGVAAQRFARPHSGRDISFQLISKRHALLLSGG